MSIKAGLFTISAAGLIVGLSACGSSDTTAPAASSATSSMSSPTSASATTSAPGVATSAASPAAPPAVITIKAFKYTVPASVAPGSKISVKNEDGENHTLTSAVQGAFNVKATAGTTATFTAPAKPGSYAFVCTFHGNMMGTLVVK